VEGKRIRLRDFRSDDLAHYEQWLTPGQEWHEWDAPYLNDLDGEWVRGHIESVREGIATGDWDEPRRRIVIADRESDLLMGALSRYWISKETHWPAVGIDIYDPAWWGQGIGFEALTLWCDHLFVAMPEIVRIDLRTWSGNERMIRLAKRLGFKEEARFRDARIVKGEYYDGLGFGVLRREWEGRAASR